MGSAADAGWMPSRYSKGWTYTFSLTRFSEVSPQLEALLAAIFSEEEQSAEVQEQPSLIDDPSSEQKALVSYCLELDALHEDLDFLLYEMDTSVRFLHTESLEDKRMAIIYHTDNHYLRTHAYLEKVFRLINHFLDLKFRDEDHGLREKVLAALREPRLRHIQTILLDLQSDRLIWKSIRGRHRLVHTLADRERWTVITPDQRADEHFKGKGAIEEVERIANLDQLHRMKQDEFGQICARLERFRDELVVALKSAKR